MAIHVDDLIVHIELESSRQFIDLFESQIASQLKLIRSASVSKVNKSMWSQEARQSLRYAFFLRYYASFENHLRVICDRAAETDSLTLRLSDIGGDNFLNRVNKYITRVVDSAALDRHPLWNDVLSYAWIRNTIIHNNGRVSKNNIPQHVSRQLSKPNAGLSLTPKGSLKLKRQFCNRSIKNMAQFLLDIYGRKNG